MAFPKKRKLLAALGISTAFARLTGLPLSLLSASAKRSRLASSNSYIFINILLRSSKVVCDHTGNVALSNGCLLDYEICHLCNSVCSFFRTFYLFF